MNFGDSIGQIKQRYRVEHRTNVYIKAYTKKVPRNSTHQNSRLRTILHAEIYK